MTEMPRRFVLRQRTAAAHAAVDAAVGSFVDLASYRTYLRSLYLFRAPLESRLDALWPGLDQRWHPSRVAQLVRDDMEDLDVDTPTGSATGVPFGADQLLGAAYVLEGSTLGARILYGRAQALGLSAAHGARHLAYLSGNIESWRGFLAVLEDADPFDIDRAVDASLATFDAARAAFQIR